MPHGDARSLHDQPSTCSGCGAPWRSESHVLGQTKCCPDCDHTEPSVAAPLLHEDES